MKNAVSALFFKHLTFYFLLLLNSDSGEKKAGRLLINMTNEKMSGMLHYCGTPDIFNNYGFLYLFLIMLAGGIVSIATRNKTGKGHDIDRKSVV